MSGTAAPATQVATTPAPAHPVASKAVAAQGRAMDARSAAIALAMADNAEPTPAPVPVTAPTPEAAKPAPVDGTKPDPRMAAQLAASMRKEAQANAMKIAADKAIKEAGEKSKAAEEATLLLDAVRKGDKSAIRLLQKENPALYKIWTETLVKGETEQPEDPRITEALKKAEAAEARIKELEGKAMSAEENSARVQTLQDIDTATAGEDFELFRAMKGAKEAVLEAALEHFRQWQKAGTGEPYQDRSWSEYAKAAQEELEATITPLLQTKAGKGIVQKLLGAVASTPQTGTSAPDAATGQPMRTVTNNDASAAPAPSAAVKESRSQILARLRKEAEEAKAA